MGYSPVRSRSVELQQVRMWKFSEESTDVCICCDSAVSNKRGFSCHDVDRRFYRIVQVHYNTDVRAAPHVVTTQLDQYPANESAADDNDDVKSKHS
jgi:hypothetical protein